MRMMCGSGVEAHPSVAPNGEMASEVGVSVVSYLRRCMEESRCATERFMGLGLADLPGT